MESTTVDFDDVELIATPVGLTINGRSLSAEADETILAAATRHGIEIPALCSDPRIAPNGQCGVCVVEIAGVPEQVHACQTAVRHGMAIVTESATLKARREKVLTGLLGNHNAYCLAPCQHACPAGTEVAGYVGLIAQGKYAAATALVKEKVPLPGVLGRVCPHPCEDVCRRAQIDKPVAICALKRYAADRAAAAGEPTQPPPAESSGKRVAVVGSGPAGLSAAYYLALDGHAVTIYEAKAKPGGMLRYGIPSYRLPRNVLDQEIDDIVSLGVRIETDKALGRDYGIQDLKAAGADAVFVSVGASLGKAAGIPGDDAPNVLSAIDFLARVGRGERIDPGRNVIVVGGGFTAADAARTSRRLGACDVTMMYRRSRVEMPASPSEIHEAEIEGVELDLLSAPVEVRIAAGRAVGIVSRRMRLGEPDASGRRRPEAIAGSEYFTPADTILMAIGQDVDLASLNEDFPASRWNTISVDTATMMTEMEGVFSAGDCVSGAATVVEAVGSARRTAVAISAYLRGETQRNIAKLLETQKPAFFDIAASPKSGDDRCEMPVVPGDARKAAFGMELAPGNLGAETAEGAFAEVEAGFDEETALREAARCLQCTCQAAGTCGLQKYSIAYGAGTKVFTGSPETASFPPLSSPNFFEMNREKCIRCLSCVRICDEVQRRSVYTVGGDGYPALLGGGTDYRDTECNNCGQCVSACPTGALKDLTDTGRLLSSERRRTTTVCGFCGVGCVLDLEAEGGRVVAVRNSFASEANEGNLCVKGRFGMGFINHRDRLTHPWIRRGGKGAPLEKATWDEAIRHVAERLRDIRQRHGPHAIGGLTSARATNEDNYVFQKFIRTVVGTNNIDHCASLCHSASVVALMQAVGSGAPSASTRDIGEADAFLIVGSNTTQTHPVISGSVLKAKHLHGARIVVIDPRRIEMVDHADVWLHPRTGTNVAVLNALAHVIVEEGLANQAFIDARTEGFQAYRESLRGYTPEFVSGITGVPAERIREAARIYARASRGMILWGMGVTQHLSGVDGAFGLVNLSLLTGHVGRRGAGFVPLRGQSNVQGASDMLGPKNALPGYQRIDDPGVRAKFEALWGAKLPDNRSLTVVEMEQAAARGEIKAMYIMGENPVGSSPDAAEVEEALKSLEFLVVQEIFMSETASLADVVLPVVSFAEKDGTFTNTERRVQLLRPAIPPVGDAKPDWQVVCEVSAAMGHPMPYPDSAAIMEEISRAAPQYAGIRHERLRAGGIMWPCPDTEHPGTRILYEESFPRGRGRFTPVEYRQSGEAVDDEFPLVLSTGRLLQHYHTGTMSRRASSLDSLTPHGHVDIHPEDARRCGIADGEMVRVVTKRGAVQVRARISERSLEGEIFLPFHFAEASANRLTSSRLDPASKTPGFKRSAARIERIH
jgi:formate dehydrogenase major subunit